MKALLCKTNLAVCILRLQCILFTLTKIYFLFVLFAACNSPNFNGICDPNSKEFSRISIVRAVLGDKSTICINSSSTPAPVPVFLTAFSFIGSTNDLNQNYVGTIAGTEITINLPYGKASTAIPTLTTNATSILVGGISIVNGVTPVDFTIPVTFTLISSDGTQQGFTVTTYLTTPVEDSGQNNCYVEGFNAPAISVSCTVSATIYPRQDGDFVDFPNPKSYQMPSVNSSFPNDSINKNTLKGIVWKTCSQGWSTSSCATGSTSTFNFTNATNACNALNSANSGAGYAGLKNWRLPNIQELFQLQTFKSNGTFMDSTFFPNAQAVNHKTSSIMLSSGNTLYVNGGVSNTTTATLEAVRCVSGATYPTQDLVDNGDGTILDKRTSLVWQKCSNGQTSSNCSTGSVTNLNSTNAMITCKNLTLAGKTWRLPNVMELKTILDLTRNAAPFVNLTFFPNAQSALYQTSTNLMSNDAYAYEMNLSTINVGTSNNKSTGATGYQARCVSGP